VDGRDGREAGTDDVCEGLEGGGVVEEVEYCCGESGGCGVGTCISGLVKNLTQNWERV
jgi:hypothetical protein